MTVLASKAIRDGLNIDTLERGLIYSTLLLRASNTLNAPVNTEAENAFTNAVQIITDLVQVDEATILPTIEIHGKIPYDNQQALKRGGNFLEYLKVFSNADPNPFQFNCTPTVNNPLPIPVEPETVNTLERYFAWCSELLLCGLVSKNPIDTESITFSFLEEDTEGPSIEINAIIPYDLKVFLLEHNLLNASKALITSLPNQPEQSEYRIDNPNRISNATRLGNA